MRRLIFTGDDFGLHVTVNEAVEIAHTQGVLSAASLMVGAEAADDAIARARRLPRLRVGLHLVVADGRAVLPPRQIPDLVNADGRFHDGLVAAGVRFFFRPRVRRQLEAEIEAQFAAFTATGLPLDHVNAHNHMHLHPTVLKILLRTGRYFGLAAIRVPAEPAAFAALPGVRPSWTATAGRLGTGALARQVRRRAGEAGLRSNDHVCGLSHTGAMVERTVLAALQRLPEGVSEFYFHPATARSPAFDRSMASYSPLAELAALTSPRVQAALAARNLTTIGFTDI